MFFVLIFVLRILLIKYKDESCCYVLLIKFFLGNSVLGNGGDEVGLVGLKLLL